MEQFEVYGYPARLLIEITTENGTRVTRDITPETTLRRLVGGGDVGTLLIPFKAPWQDRAMEAVDEAELRMGPFS